MKTEREKHKWQIFKTEGNMYESIVGHRSKVIDEKDAREAKKSGLSK